MYKTIKEAVHDMFFREVLGIKAPLKIRKNTTLLDFCQNKKFEKEYLEMIIDRTNRVLNVNIRKMKDKNLTEILKYIEDQKTRRSKYGVY